MPISFMSVFIAIILINHIGLLRVAAADELSEQTLTHVPLCGGLLTGITFLISMTLLALINPYLDIIPTLRALDHFIYLLIMALTAHALCFICYKLKPASIIPALLPLMLMNSVGLGAIVLKINMGVISTLTTLAVSVIFIITSTLFYYAHLWFNASDTPINAKRLSILLLMVSLFALLLSGLITFY